MSAIFKISKKGQKQDLNSHVLTVITTVLHCIAYNSAPQAQNLKIKQKTGQKQSDEQYISENRKQWKGQGTSDSHRKERQGGHQL
jgi:hypothetical protein